MRLQGYPGASELFVRLQQLGIDDKHYFAVLDGGRRQLLSTTLQNRSRYNWLQNLGEVSRRRSLWEGLLRIAEGVLHLGDVVYYLSFTALFFLFAHRMIEGQRWT